jgi:galactofuranosylgalactofuranosylrhamnosyl-N-acetylglucosaminyl-diphospho-decaprenol beta-1,5/1,6-galactofuranosyltransferase
VLHSYGEVIHRQRWFWGPAPKTFYGHDFKAHPLRQTPWLHRRIDVDYNGWWMCLIPLDVIRKAGLPLPLFIKWDDAEWGLRAKTLGLRTVTLPGVAVWHVPWHEKDDTIDWQAYFHERNRLLSGLLHSRFPRGGSLIRESMQACLRHLACMQYSAAELVLRAVEDLLSGPEHLHRDLPTVLGEVRELRKHYPDAQHVKTMDEFPQVHDKRLPSKRSGWNQPPTGRFGLYNRAAKALLRNLLPVDPDAKLHPQAVVPHVDQAWWLLAGYDSALVSSADGTATAWYVRDRRRFVTTFTRAVRLHTELYRRWPELRRVYRDALPDLVSPEQWRGTFTGKPEPLHHAS